MKINPNIEIIIQRHIQKYLTDNKLCSIKELIDNYKNPILTTEAELRNGINNALKTGNIQIINKKRLWEESIVNLSKPFLFDNINGSTYNNVGERVCIVVSLPRLRKLSVGCIEERNGQIDTIDCFREIITSSRRILRICSPFAQRNVLNDDSFPDLKDLIMDALDRNVEIRLLSRELFEGRGDEIQWIVDIANDLGKEDKLTVVDYHLLSDQRSVLSSIHAKLLIADNTVAYVGSAELRRNSIVTNLEVGCMIFGSTVFGICEVFDSIFFQGTIWKLE